MALPIGKLSELQTKVQAGTHATSLLEFANHHFLGPREDKIKKDLFAQIESDVGLDPVVAVQAWIQIYEAHKMVRSLQKLRRDGISAGEQIEKSNAAPH